MALNKLGMARFPADDPNSIKQTLLELAQGNMTPTGSAGTFIPKTTNIPSYEDWMASGAYTPAITNQAGTIRTGGGSANTPEYEYLNQFYDIPSRSPDFLAQYGPMLAGLGGAGLVAAGAGTLGAAGAGAAAAPSASLPAAGTTLEGIGGAGTGLMSGTGVTMGPLSVGTGVDLAGAGGSLSGTPISRLLGLDQNSSDLLSVLGTAGATGLGAYSANQQADALRDLAAQSRADRAPFLGAATNYLNNPQAFIEGPGQAAMKGTLAGLSAKFGNPIGSGAALQFATDAGLRNWLDATTGLANIGLSGEDTRARLGSAAIGKEGDIYSTIAGGASDIINPRRSLADLLKEYKGMGLI